MVHKYMLISVTILLAIVVPGSWCVITRDGGFIQSAKYSTCIAVDVAGGADNLRKNGLPLKLDACTGNPEFIWNAPAFRYYTTKPWWIENYYSKRCLDVPNAQTGNGVRLDIWDCVVEAKQEQWKVIGGTVDTKFMIQNVNSGKCITAEGGGTYIDQWDCVGAEHQYWKLPWTTTVAY